MISSHEITMIPSGCRGVGSFIEKFVYLNTCVPLAFYVPFVFIYGHSKNKYSLFFQRSDWIICISSSDI